jgi:hypothetical protein
MPYRRIPRADWVSFLDSFSRSHAGWLVTVEIVSERALAAVEARQLPLEGIVADVKGRRDHRISILLGESGQTRVTHAVCDPKTLRFEKTPDGSDRGLELVAGDGSKTILRFAAPSRPELVDGLPGQPHALRRH